MSFIIFSVFEKNQSNKLNIQSHAWVIAYLKQYNIPHKEVNGVYLETSEKSILVLPDNEDFVIDICKIYEQECYLYVNDLKQSFLRYPDGTEKFIGIWRNVQSNNYDSYTESEGRYYTAISF